MQVRKPNSALFGVKIYKVPTALEFVAVSFCFAGSYSRQLQDKR